MLENISSNTFSNLSRYSAPDQPEELMSSFSATIDFCLDAACDIESRTYNAPNL